MIKNNEYFFTYQSFRKDNTTTKSQYDFLVKRGCTRVIIKNYASSLLICENQVHRNNQSGIPRFLREGIKINYFDNETMKRYANRVIDNDIPYKQSLTIIE